MAGTVAIMSYFLEDMMLFDHGMLVQLGNGEKAVTILNLHRQKLKDKGIGVEFRLKSHTLHVLSSSSVLCWATWEIDSVDQKIGRLEWTNGYYYRARKDGKAGFEMILSDNETEILLQKFPDWYDGMDL